MSEVKKGRPTKAEQELKERIKTLEEELERAQEVAQNNLEYAKQASKDVDRVQAEVFAKGSQIKELLNSFTDFLSTLDQIMRLTRKSLERDITKEYGFHREEKEGE